MNKEEKKEILQSLRHSCEEGMDGTWDCSADGFEAMIAEIDQLAQAMGITLEGKVFYYARKCDVCSRGMNEGYVVNNGDEYYCSDTCLHKKYDKKEWSQMYNSEEGSSYWTQWDETHDMEYKGDRDGNIAEEL